MSYSIRINTVFNKAFEPKIIHYVVIVHNDLNTCVYFSNNEHLEKNHIKQCVFRNKILHYEVIIFSVACAMTRIKTHSDGNQEQ